MFRRKKWSLKDRIEQLEKDVQYKETYLDSGEAIDIDEAIRLLFRHLNLEVGLQKKDASKTS